MKIGKATVPESAICTYDEETIVVRGADLCEELIGKLGFVDYFHLLVTGRRPDAVASRVLDATLVAIAEHGLVPSVQASRMTLAAAPDAIQGAVAAGILGCGSVILGASETAGRLFLRVDALARREVAGARGRRHRGGARTARSQAGDPRLRPSAAQGARPARCAPVRGGAGSRRADALRAHCRGGRDGAARDHGSRPAPERVGGDPCGAARRRLSRRSAEGRADPGALRGPDRAPDGRARPADRLRAVVPGHARATLHRRAAAGRARRRWRSEDTIHGQGSRRGARARARHLHHRPGGVDAAGRPGCRRDQGRAARRRPVPRLSRRPVQPALPDLQPQQEERHARHARARTTWRASRRWWPRPTSTSRTSARAWPRRSAPARRACAS